MSIVTRLAEVKFVHCVKELSYCRHLRDVIVREMELSEGDPGLNCCSFDKLHTNLYVVQGGTHRVRALEFKVRQKIAARSLGFLRWHTLNMFCASSEI